MSAEEPRAPARTRWSRRWWPAIGASLGALAGAVALGFATPVYEASSSVLIVPQRVPDDLVRSMVTTTPVERLNVISQQILSRTRLERLLTEFDLYKAARQRLIMEDVIAQMRSDISFRIDVSRDRDSPTMFRIAYRSPDARMALRVTERLAALFVQENLEDRELLADQTNQFLVLRASEARGRLLKVQAELEAWDRRGGARARPDDIVARHEVLQEHYRSVLRKVEEARMAVNLERRQISEQFRIIDGARLPERAMAVVPLPFLAWGVLGGLASSLLLMLLSSWRRRRLSPAPQS
jgi:uncharacterized protein involved in exopolysaccharide biosynthesis